MSTKQKLTGISSNLDNIDDFQLPKAKNSIISLYQLVKKDNWSDNEVEYNNNQYKNIDTRILKRKRLNANLSIDEGMKNLCISSSYNNDNNNTNINTNININNNTNTYINTNTKSTEIEPRKKRSTNNIVCDCYCEVCIFNTTF